MATGTKKGKKSDDFFTDIDSVEEFTNTLYYGREGTGKTTAAARLANVSGGRKVLFINAEGGAKKRALAKLGIDTDNIKVWPPVGEKVTLEGLRSVYTKISGDLADDPESWFGVVIDSATEVHQNLLEFATERRVTATRNKGQDVDEFFVDRSDYGVMSKIFRDMLRKFRDLPCHVVITALERRDVDEDDGSVVYGPAVTPGIASDLLGYMDFVLMIKAEDADGPFRALTRPLGKFRAKDRFNVLPQVLGEPGMDRVLAYMHDEIVAEDDPIQATVPVPKKKKPRNEDD